MSIKKFINRRYYYRTRQEVLVLKTELKPEMEGSTPAKAWQSKARINKMKKNKRDDTAKNIILMLFILTILISAVSTWVIMGTIDNFQKQYKPASSIQQGYVSVEVIPRPAEVKTTGQVILEVIPKPAL